MKRILLRIAVTLGVVLALYVAVLASEWLPRPDPVEAKALAHLEAPVQVPEGGNAYAVAWFLYHDLRGRDPDEAMREEVARRQAAVQAGRGDEFIVMDGIEPDQKRLPVPGFCPSPPESCLDHVRAVPDHGAAELAAHSTVLRRLDALHRTTHLRYPFRLQDPLQFPTFAGTFQIMRMEAAKRFVDDSPSEGLGLACRNLATWRRLAANGNILVDGMIGGAGIQGHAALVAEMLGEWPADTPLPDACGVALAPIGDDERDRCDIWIGEFRFLQASVRRPYAERRLENEDDVPWMPAFVGDLLLNSRAAALRVAPELAARCDGFDGQEPLPPDWTDWTFDPAGTLQEQLRDPDGYGMYDERLDDQLATLDAVRLQAYLRDAQDIEAAMAALPDDLREVSGLIDVDPTARTITVDFVRPATGPASWTFRLPPRSLPDTPPAG